MLTLIKTTQTQTIILILHSNPVAVYSTVQVFLSTKQYTFFCSYSQCQSIFCLHCLLPHATVSYFALCYTIGTCIYVHTVLQNGLQISSTKKCLMIWYVFMYYLCGTEVAQTMYSVCIPCGTWNGKSSFLYRINIKHISSQQ
jgi:hypothetical protein